MEPVGPKPPSGGPGPSSSAPVPGPLPEWKIKLTLIRPRMVELIQKTLSFATSSNGKSGLELEEYFFSKASTQEEYFDFIKILGNKVKVRQRSGVGVGAGAGQAQGHSSTIATTSRIHIPALAPAPESVCLAGHAHVGEMEFAPLPILNTPQGKWKVIRAPIFNVPNPKLDSSSDQSPASIDMDMEPKGKRKAETNDNVPTAGAGSSNIKDQEQMQVLRPLHLHRNSNGDWIHDSDSTNLQVLAAVGNAPLTPNLQPVIQLMCPHQLSRLTRQLRRIICMNSQTLQKRSEGDQQMEQGQEQSPVQVEPDYAPGAGQLVETTDLETFLVDHGPYMVQSPLEINYPFAFELEEKETQEPKRKHEEMESQDQDKVEPKVHPIMADPKYINIIKRLITRMEWNPSADQSKLRCFKKLHQAFIHPIQMPSYERLTKIQETLDKLDTNGYNDETFEAGLIDALARLIYAVEKKLGAGSAEAPKLKNDSSRVKAKVKFGLMEDFDFVKNLPDLPSDSLDSDDKKIPFKSFLISSLERELNWIDPKRFKIVTADLTQPSPQLTINLGNPFVSTVPDLRIRIPEKYPDEEPILLGFDKDYGSSSFLIKISQRMKDAKRSLPFRYTLINLLDIWEISVRKTMQ